LENCKVSWKFIALKPYYDILKSILEFVNFNNDLDINFICCGNNGYRA